MSKKSTNSKSKKSTSRKAKINVTYVFHLWFDNTRKVTQIVRTSHYKKSIVDTNWIDLEQVFEDVQLSKYYVSLDCIGAVDIYCEHPDIRDYQQIATYNNKKKQLTWNPAIVIFESSLKDTSKKSKKKVNQSLLYQIILRPKQSGGSDYICDIKLRVLSLFQFNQLKSHFNQALPSQSQSITYNAAVKNKNINDGSIATENGWSCEVCTYYQDDALQSCSMCGTARATKAVADKTNASPRDVKETMVDEKSVENIDDLLSDNENDEDCDLTIVSPKHSKKRLRLNISGASQPTYSPPANTNNAPARAKQDPQTLLSNLESENQWLIKQTYKITTIEHVRIIGNRFAAIKQIDNNLGCIPMGAISGCGSNTNAKNIQKLLIAFDECNEKREEESLDTYQMPIGSKMNVDQYCKDRFGKRRKDLERSVQKPGDNWPKSGDDGINDVEIKNQKDLMEKRYKIWIGYKKLKKTIKKN